MDGSNMRAPSRLDRVWNGTKKFAGWMRRDFAEWFVGSWALIIGWAVFAIIFFNFLLMDGHFSRGLGEGSGVNPDRFQQVGWAYRIFAALFMMLAMKLVNTGLKRYAWAIRSIGILITAIVIMHATGFGLKALEGKRDSAAAVEAVATETVQSNTQLIATLEARQETIRSDLKLAVDPLKARMANLDKDGKFNEERTDALQARVAALENAANAKIDKIDDEILAATVSGGEEKVENAEALATNEEWAPLFVGLAQFFTWSQEPSDWAIYLCGVIFIIFWVIVGDLIAIITPSALYALHLADAKNQKPKAVRVDPDVMKDIQAQLDELARRKANLGEGAQKAVKTKTKKKKVQEARAAIEDMRTELAKREAADKQKIADAIDEMNATIEEIEEDFNNPETAEPELEPQTPADEPQPEQQEELQLTEEVAEDSEGEPEPKEYPVPAVIETDAPANEDEEKRDAA